MHFETAQNYAFYHVASDENAGLSSPLFAPKEMTISHQGHRPLSGGGYCPASPVDTQGDLRAETLETLKNLGLSVLKHHHEVAPAQQELGFDRDTLVKTADYLQIYKYVVRNVAHKKGKTATFMPKPLYGENGNGMHVHQSLWQKGVPLFLGDGYNQLSKEALYYIGGILAHARALNAFTNPTTNSYKRLVPGYEAPVYLAYSARNRSAAVRIPHSEDLKAKRLEARFPDPAANPYLGLAALLMAGLDGIQNKMDPGDALEKNLYDTAQHGLGEDHLICGSLSEALKALDADRDFLKAGGVFDDDAIDGYMALKWAEVKEVERCPNPTEFKLYYSI